MLQSLPGAAQDAPTLLVVEDEAVVAMDIAGYSSLGYISRLKRDELKVDKSLVTDVDSDAERAGLVVAALAMARILRLMVMAEGVETEAEQAFLQRHGCDMAQGFLHARPIPAPEFEVWLAAAGPGGDSAH